MNDPRLAQVRLVITDVDGVLTDGSLYYGPDGEMMKRFNVHDGLGVRLLQQIGVVVAVVSGRSGAAVERRMKDLGIDHVQTGISDKGQASQTLMANLAIDPKNAIFVGDDIIDLPGFRACGLSAAVANAPRYVQDCASMVLHTKGGEGAFRELADAILVAQGHGQLLTGGGVFKPADGGSAQ